MKIFLTEYRNWFIHQWIFHLFRICFKKAEKRACKVDNDQIIKTSNHRFNHRSLP